MFDDWMIAIIGVIGFFVAILCYILKTWREIARVEGRLESLREDIRLLRNENESFRIRMKELEKEGKDEE